jgi:mannitol/fructose-specific phosphotransferase system IIA component (Ntr-type)
VLLGEILHRGVIEPELRARERFTAIDELIGLLVASGDLAAESRDAVREVIYARERSMATGMEDGVALPHGSTDRVRNVIGALGISREGIDFGCLDCGPARLIILLVLPRDEFQVHVRTLAGVSHLLNEPDFRERLLAAADRDEILKLVRREEGGSLLDGWRRRFR